MKKYVAPRSKDWRSRAIALRRAAGYGEHGGTQRFAAFLGISQPRWSNMESGLPLKNELAMIIYRKLPGITLEWLYMGVADNLSRDWKIALGLMGEPPSGPGRHSTGALPFVSKRVAGYAKE